MVHTKGAVDKKKRVRKPMSEDAKRKRDEKKKREATSARNKNAKASFIAAMTPKGPENNQGNGMNEDSNQQEAGIQYDEVNVQDCNGTTDLGEILAVLDNEYEGEGNEAEMGIMKEYMQAIMKQYQTEDSQNFDPNGCAWLKDYLNDHGYHIRAECVHLVCKKLGIQFHEQEYYRDICVWFPKEEGGMMCMPTCPTCKRNDSIRKHSYPMNHPGRRVTTFNTHYYIMSRQYLCKWCKEENNN
jgi:hypothetical protein